MIAPDGHMMSRTVWRFPGMLSDLQQVGCSRLEQRLAFSKCAREAMFLPAVQGSLCRV